MKILAGIVLYNPEIGRLKENIEAIYKQVDMILAIDNGSKNGKDIKSLIDNYPNVSKIENSTNLGVATALFQIMQYAKENKFSWVLTLDQDSVCFPRLIETYSQYFTLDHAGILTCNIIDRNFHVDTGFTEGENYREVKQCITSASIVNVEAFSRTDGFDEKLFIDSVDFDICINMRRHGFKVYKINYEGVLHEVGHGKNVKLFAKDYISYNHNPFRQYYMARNHKYLVRKYPEEFFVFKEIMREIRAEVIILLYEKNKVKKLTARWRGLRDADKMIASLK